MRTWLVGLGITAVGILAAPGNSLAQDVTVPPADAAAAPAEKPQLTGRWKLNPEKSDDAHAKMKEAMAAGRRAAGEGGGPGGGPGSGGSGGGYGGGGRHMGGGGGGGHMGGGMGGGRPPGGPGSGGGASDEKRALARAAMDDVLNPGEILTITQKEPEVIITSDDGRVRTLYTDGRKVKGKDGAPEQTTRWETGRLLSESKIDSGPTIRESYSIDAESKALKVTAFIQMPRSETPVIVHMHYDAAPPE